MKTRSPYEPLIYVGLILTGIVAGGLWSRFSPKGLVSEQTRLEQIMQLIDAHYVDSIDDSKLEEDAIQKLLASFDPHSVYIPARYVDIANQELKGGFDGIGIEFFMMNDTPYVVRVIDNGPAQVAGIQSGDRLILSDTSLLISRKNSEIINLLKGEKGSSVKLKVYRPSIGKTEIYEVKRDAIRQESVRSMKLDKETAYFHILHFAEPTHDEFTAQFKKLNSKNEIKKIILDFRGNPGGYLNTAIEMLDEFIDESTVLAYTSGRNEERKNYNSTPGGLCTKQELICLVDERSASASEIFSGAIQDLDRGLIVGRRTYGKGLVQESFQLSDGAQVRLTVSRYYIPSGRSIQKPYDEDGYLDEDTATYVEKSFKTKRGRTVYAQGGIMPDIEIGQTEDFENYPGVAEQSVYVVDQLLKKHLTDSSGNASKWSESIGLMTKVNSWKSDSSSTQAIVDRIIYQLYGPQQAMESEIYRDGYVQMAISQFGKLKDLLNP
ncbi:MAG: PDZ domain-containing protein [Bacteroidetes bacterium]|nr:PDZ domain-containing protein [Bacteroidota bacterium]